MDPVLGNVTDGDTFKVILFQQLYSQRIMNVLHYVCTDPGGTPPDRFQVCRNLVTNITGAGGLLDSLLAVQSVDLSHTSIRAQYQKESNLAYPFFEETETTEGGLPGAAGTANTAASLEKRADVDPAHPRRGIGRMAVAGVPQVSYAEGLLKNEYKVLFNDLIDALQDPVTLLNGETLAPCLSRDNGTTWVDSLIFNVTLKPEVRDLTRRTVGRGK